MLLYPLLGQWVAIHHFGKHLSSKSSQPSQTVRPPGSPFYLPFIGIFSSFEVRSSNYSPQAVCVAPFTKKRRLIYSVKAFPYFLLSTQMGDDKRRSQLFEQRPSILQLSRPKKDFDPTSLDPMSLLYAEVGKRTTQR